MHTVMVTGGCGFIGSNFIHYLLETTTDVAVLNFDCLTYAGNLTNLNAALDGLTYLPGTNYIGNDLLSFSVNDLGNTGFGGALTDSANVAITVGSTNHVPVANPDSFVVDNDGRLNMAAPGVLANDLDPDGDALSVVIVSQPLHGKLDIAQDGSLTYEPDLNRPALEDGTWKSASLRLTIQANQKNKIAVFWDEQDRKVGWLGGGNSTTSLRKLPTR